jgi:hypothetical protein
MKRTLEQNTRFHKLISLLGIDAETKQLMVFDVSKGRVESSACLEEFEMQQLINRMQDTYNQMKAVELKSSDKMRRKIFSIFHDLDFEKPDGTLDYKRINDWFLKSGYLHKPVNDYKERELPELVSQVEQMLTKSYRHAEG